jgi:translocation and assembly module TamB
MRSRLRRSIVALAMLVLALAFGAAPSTRLVAAEEDKGVVAGLLSKALSSDSSSVSIGSVDGALSSDVTIRNIVLADANGPWLKLDVVHLVWNRLALFQRRLDVDTLAIGKLEILRKPLPSGKPAASEGPILPELPLKVIIKSFKAEQIVLGEPLIGVAATLGASGKATLGPPSEGLDLTLSAKRLDAGGAFDVRLAFVPQTSHLSVSAKFDEPPGGLVSKLADLPGDAPVHLVLDGDGPLDAFGAKLQFAAGPEIGANGELHLARQGAGRRLTSALKARIAGLLPPVVADVFAGETDLDANLGLADDGAIAIDKFQLASQTVRLDVTGGLDAQRQAAISLHAKSLPGAPRVESFALDVEGKGPLDALALDIACQSRGAEFDGGKLGAFEAKFLARPSGRFGDPATKIAVDGEAKISGLKLADPAYDDAFGPTATLHFGGDATTDGIVKNATLDWTTERPRDHRRGRSLPFRPSGRARAQGRVRRPD